MTMTGEPARLLGCDPAEVLVASTRHPRHIVDAAKLGAHIATIPYDLFKKLPNHPLTDVGLKKFLEDWEKVKKLK